MEFETEIITDKKQENVQKILNNRIRMGWQIHSISEISRDLKFNSKGYNNQTFGNTSASGSIWGISPIVVTYMKLSEADKKIGETLQIIAENLSKNL